MPNEPVFLAPFASTVLLSLASTSFASPEDDAITQYRTYVAAVRAGKPEDVAKLIEPVPETSKPLLTARIAQEIAVETMKKEMVAQMGTAKTGDEAWAIGGLPYDDVLKNLKGVGGRARTRLRCSQANLRAWSAGGWRARMANGSSRPAL